MKSYVVQCNATGEYYVVTVRDGDNDCVYRQFAHDVMQSCEAFSKDFDTGNVDINVFDVPCEVGTVKVDFDSVE